ncbi:MAG: Hsp70 family protein [Planctomycetaceae bacterium]
MIDFSGRFTHMQRVPIGIDLGTTYSCVSHLDRQGAPHTLPNPEGEMSTPSAVLFEGDDIVVGTEAIRNSVRQPERVVQNSKRFMGDPNKFWVIDRKTYRPTDIAAIILRYLLDGAEQHVGPIEHAVITVPAQFSDIQRQQTAEAGLKAGLKKVDIINEPVAAALCYVLGEGLWFRELADDQTVMVYDLGGGTFDLSLVKYNNTDVKVVASSGDLNLGGIDWNARLEKFACEQFIREVPDDPRLDKETMQTLSIEVEQTKRSLSVRQKASLTLQHAGRRKTYGIDQEHFELLTHDLVERTEKITRKLLTDHSMGWAHVDAVLITGGSSRMPMIRNMLKRISGTTLNQTLSPDQSISHGAAYYAGMLTSSDDVATGSFLSPEVSDRLAQMTQQSVNARGLGILVRDRETGERIPHYLLPANTPLPCAFRQSFGTVSENQRRVHLHIVESGTSEDQPPVKLGACIVEDLPPGLPAATPIEVTIAYDAQARVHVSAKEMRSGKSAKTSIVREENLLPMTREQSQKTGAAFEENLSSPAVKQPAQPTTSPQTPAAKSAPKSPTPASRPTTPASVAVAPNQGTTEGKGKASGESGRRTSPEAPIGTSTFRPAANAPQPSPQTKGGSANKSRLPSNKSAPPSAKPKPRPPQSPSPASKEIEEADRPIPLCNTCGEPLNSRGACPACRDTPAAASAPPRKRPATSGSGKSPATGNPQKRPNGGPASNAKTQPLSTRKIDEAAKQRRKKTDE